MSTIQLKTNIMCGSCIAKVTPVLNKIAGEGNWNVDTTNPKKILTATVENSSEEEVIDALSSLGYKAEKVA